jgi:class 3 adenylate cyclase
MNENPHEDKWQRILAGEMPSVNRMRRLMGAIPSGPRCKLCAAPFGHPGSALLRFAGFGPSRLNRRPGFAGEDHAEKAVAAARDLLRATRNENGEPWISVGAAVLTGVAYVGKVGEGDACDFTAVGDPANTAARLASSAAAGEILVSAAAAETSKLDTAGLESRTLAVRGRDETVDAWIAHS